MTLDTTEIQQQVSLARNYLKTKQHDRAEDILLKLLKKHNLADVCNLLGVLYSDLGKFNFAEIAFKKALSINPNYMEAALNLAVLYNNLGLGKKSKAIYQRLKKYGAAGRGAMDPMLMSKIANMHAEIGDLYHGVGEYKSAIDAYEKSVDLCPQYLDVQTKLATCFRENGESKKAVKLFKKFEKKAAKFAPFWIAWGVTSYALGKNKDAAKFWMKALKIEPRNKTALAYGRLVA